MDFTFNTEQLSLEEKCKIFAENEITPFVNRLEEDLTGRQALFVKMAKMGFFLLGVPSVKGGYLLDTIAYALALKAFAKADAGIAVAVAVTNMVGETIAHYGTEEQRKRYLSRMESGEGVPASFALTEKMAGSDAKSIQTRALQDPSHPDVYIIEGEKQFITNGDVAGVLIVMAKTDPSQEARGITAFLIDRETPGMKVIKKERKLGLLTANLVTLQFDSCRVHKSAILGQPGEGFKIAMRSLDSGRIGIAAQAMGIGEAAYEAALQFSRNRAQFGHPICENQAIAFKLADMKVKLDAGLLLLCKAAWQKDQGIPYTLAASEAKLYCSEVCNEIAGDALQIHGGYGYVKDYGVEKYFRDARVTTLYEGTSEIQRTVISRQILKPD